MRKQQHLYGPTPSHLPLKTTNYSRQHGFIIKTHHNQHRWQRADTTISTGNGSLGHRQSATVATNFELKQPRLLSHGAQSVSSFGRHVCCIFGKTSNFPKLQAYTSQQQFLRLLMTCACARRARIMDSLANWDF